MGRSRDQWTMGVFALLGLAAILLSRSWIVATIVLVGGFAVAALVDRGEPEARQADLNRAKNELRRTASADRVEATVSLLDQLEARADQDELKRYLRDELHDQRTYAEICSRYGPDLF